MTPIDKVIWDHVPELVPKRVPSLLGYHAEDWGNWFWSIGRFTLRYDIREELYHD